MKAFSSLFILCFVFAVRLSAQSDPLGFAANEAAGTGFSFNHNVHSSYISGREGQVGSTAKEVYVSALGGHFSVLLTLDPASDLTVKSVMEKIDFNQPGILGVLVGLSDGSSRWIIHNLFTGGNAVYTHAPMPGIQTGAGVQFSGDAVYGISGTTLNVSVDSGQTWTLDTTGLHGATLHAVDIDSAQNAYVATSNGVYKQPLGGSTWALTSCPTGNTTALLVDHYNNRVYAAGNYLLYYSADEGSTWHVDTSGIANQSVYALGSNGQGDIFAIINTQFSFNSGDQLFISTGGTGTFTRIDQPIQAYNGQPNNASIFTSVTGDSSSITAGSKIGFFSSTDKGATWAPTTGINSKQCYGLAVANNGTLVANNNLGCFTRPANSNVWTKVAPANMFAPGGGIYRALTGDLYAQVLNQGGYAGPWLVVKSTDNGVTWAPDSAGVAGMQMYSWWVDELGNQYAGGAGLPCINSVKAPSGSWHVDTTGVVPNSTGDYGTAFGGDGNGHIYYALYSGNIFMRPVGGTTWGPTTGLGTDAVYSFAHTGNHTVIAGGTGNVHYTTGTAWQNMTISAPAPQGKNPFIVAADDSDYVWVAFSEQGSSGNYYGDGVFYTHDLGNTWYPAVGQVLGATFRALVPSGDSVFGLSYFDGVFVFKRGAGSTAVQKVSDAPQYMAVYPNPFSGQTNIQYIIPEQATVTLTILGLNGQTICTLKHAAETEGLHNTMWNAQGMATGIYLCQLTATGISGQVYSQTMRISFEAGK